MNKLGLIAGNGNFPVLLARQAQKAGYSVYTASFTKDIDSNLKKISKSATYLKIGQLSACINFFKSNDVKKVVMGGLIKHSSVFDLIPDLRATKLLTSLKDKRAATVLKAIISEFAKEGIEFTGTEKLLKDHLAKCGILTKTKPDKVQQKNIQLGWKAAKTLADLDVGLTSAVCNGVIVALEGMEGTDRCIIRAGELCKTSIKKPELTVVKVARTKQDFRFDLPVIGVNTIKSMLKAGAKTLAIEANKTLLLDKDELIKLANQNKISIVVQ